jgi:hypothetical protein
MRHISNIGSVTIASGQTASGILSSRIGFGMSSDLVIYTPAALTGVVKLLISDTDSETDLAEFRYMYFNGDDVELPAGKAVVIPGASFGALYLLSSLAEAADRTFQILSQLDV